MIYHDRTWLEKNSSLIIFIKARWLIMKILHPKEPKFICENHNKYSWLMKLKLHITKKHADYSWFFNYSFIQPSWWSPRTSPFSCDDSRNWNDIDTNTNRSTTIHRYELDKIYARFFSSNSSNFQFRLYVLQSEDQRSYLQSQQFKNLKRVLLMNTVRVSITHIVQKPVSRETIRIDTWIDDDSGNYMHSKCGWWSVGNPPHIQ